LDQLRIEDERFQLLDDECKTKVHTYQQVSVATDTKLDHLRSLADNFSSADCCKLLQVLNFVKRVEEKQKFGTVAIKGNVQAVQLASHTSPGNLTLSIPLCIII
jgi:hypothetical protein